MADIPSRRRALSRDLPPAAAPGIPPATRIGVIGLGVMGGGMASRLLDQGHRIVVHNRTPERAAPFAARGAVVAATPAELASQVDVVLLSLASEAAVEEQLFGAGGVLETLPAHGIVMDTSTVSPDFARSVAERVAGRGRSAVDACIIGNGQHAKDGELRFMVGGSAETFERLSAVLEPLAKEIRHLGPSGLGATAKVMLNVLMGVEMQVLAESVTLAQRAGIDRELALSMISESGFSSPVMKYKAGVMRRRAYGEPQFRLDLMRKDLRLATAEAGRLGVATPVCDATHETLVAAAEAGLGELDCAAVLSHAEVTAGLPGTPDRT
ncbi:NAD(P)-dependent oxidoreductase [Kitasatospora sp. NPDC089913]|uniref:NAD(P)-dependent oxidoreductase n=1 Tax=Streptomycetaceae TaxID=2062 RepID=UPI00087A6381|nr:MULTISPECIES: NAD(P)-dependent oxidoreductase [unclassified Streptomyces]SDT53276.1 3-hydroxyisobutyrate dehydrogenase [Streptomyces sp. TLI_053]